MQQRRLYVLLGERKEHPHRGRWSLPGGFVGMEESLASAARRVMEQRVQRSQVFLEQLYSFGEPSRDPRMRVVSVSYYALVCAAPAPAGSAWCEVEVPWEGETGGPVIVRRTHGVLETAFDHADIIGMAVRRIRGKLDYTPIGFQLLPERFTLRALQEVHETVLGRGLNKDSFRRRMLTSGQLEATGEREAEVGHRPAELYRFARRSAI